MSDGDSRSRSISVVEPFDEFFWRSSLIVPTLPHPPRPCAAAEDELAFRGWSNIARARLHHGFHCERLLCRWRAYVLRSEMSAPRTELFVIIGPLVRCSPTNSGKRSWAIMMVRYPRACLVGPCAPRMHVPVE